MFTKFRDKTKKKPKKVLSYSVTTADLGFYRRDTRKWSYLTLTLTKKFSDKI